MKRLLSLAAVFILLVSAPMPLKARADGLRYAVAPTDSVWFYTSEEENAALFLLPETYYVRVLSEGAEYTAVEYLVNDPPYKKIVGYCRTDDLIFVDFVPARPYLFKEISVTYTIEGSAAADGFGSIHRTYVYYGNRYDGEELRFYVLYGDTFGFIPAKEPLEFDKNDDWKVSPPVSGVAETSSPALIVLILLAVAAVLAAGFFALRGKKPPPDDDL